MISRVWAAAVLTTCTATVLAARPLQRQSTAPAGQLNSRIAAADKRRFQSITDARAWRNPYLVIGADGIEVIATSLPAGRNTVASSDLQRTLIELPVNAWPYGRVVVVQDTGLRASDRSDEEPINRNREAALNILKALRVHVERWPSA
jgi:hypothetical protein